MSILITQNSERFVKYENKPEVNRLLFKNINYANSDEVKEIAYGAYPVVTPSEPSAIASFNDGADNIPVENITVQIVPYQEGIGDPSPDNIRPIYGWTGANVTQSKNQFLTVISNNRTVNGITLLSNSSNNSLSISGTATSNTGLSIYNIETFSSATDVTILDLPTISSTNAYWYVYDTTSNAQIGDNFDKGGVTRTIPANHACVLAVFIKNNRGITVTIKPKAVDIYTTIPISWQTEVGTVYGGSLDVTTGVLTVDKKSVTLNEDSNWTMYAEGKFFCPAISVNEASLTTGGAGYLCNQYRVAGTGDSQSSHIVQDKRVYGQRGYGRFWVYDSTYSTLEAFQTALESNALQIVYPLTTPITIQLDPVTISTLLGQNNIWADTGNVSVGYRADNKMYVDEKVATAQSLMELLITANRETSMTASQAYTEGDLLIINGTLYKAASNIASGATFTPGTNVIATTVAEQLASIA